VQQVAAEQVPAAMALAPDLVLRSRRQRLPALRFDLSAASTAVERSVRSLRGGGSDVLLFAFGNPARRLALMGLIKGRIWAYDQALRAIASHYGCYLVDLLGRRGLRRGSLLGRRPPAPVARRSRACRARGARGPGAWAQLHGGRRRRSVALGPGTVRLPRPVGERSPWPMGRAPIQGRSSGDEIQPKLPVPIACAPGAPGR
jgi:hypothetical protein